LTYQRVGVYFNAFVESNANYRNEDEEVRNQVRRKLTRKLRHNEVIDRSEEG